MSSGTIGSDAILAGAVRQFARSWPLAMAAARASFGGAYFMHQSLISRATGARGIGRADVRTGSETPALKAYASGLREGNYVVTLTRGLVDRPADELEAVLGYELTHIRRRDTQLMVIAVIFAGIFAFFGDLTIRMRARTAAGVSGLCSTHPPIAKRTKLCAPLCWSAAGPSLP